LTFPAVFVYNPCVERGFTPWTNRSSFKSSTASRT